MIALLMIPALILAGVVNLIRSFFDWLRGE
jgi:hypothetical protein